MNSRRKRTMLVKYWQTQTYQRLLMQSDILQKFSHSGLTEPGEQKSGSRTNPTCRQDDPKEEHKYERSQTAIFVYFVKNIPIAAG